MGSMRVARTAGTYDAANATNISRAVTPAMVHGIVGVHAINQRPVRHQLRESK